MGTRGFITFVADGVEKTAYNHCDSYPGGLGVDVLTFLRANRHELTCDRHSQQSGSAPDLIRKLRVVDPGSTPTPADVQRLSQFANLNVSTRSADDWYVLLRETQGDPAAMLTAGVIEDAKDFPLDSLFAEYGYVVDIDARTFEAYEGFQHDTHDKGRFAARQGREGYAPVALAKSWPLDSLPSDEEFLAALEENDDDEDAAR